MRRKNSWSKVRHPWPKEYYESEDISANKGYGLRIYSYLALLAPISDKEAKILNDVDDNPELEEEADAIIQREIKKLTKLRHRVVENG